VPDALITKVFAGYRIDSRVGRGGMGVVYRATDLTLDRAVALKVLSDDLAQDDGFRRRFVTESKLAASLDHPNVLRSSRSPMAQIRRGRAGRVRQGQRRQELQGRRRRHRVHLPVDQLVLL